jgi:hypothetical protein
MGLDAIEGKRLDYAAIASEGLTELNQGEADLAEIVIAENQKEVFKEYISVTRKLLEEMKRLTVAEGAV